MMDTDVLVVGGGPVGETLLNLLGAQGVSAIGFEKDADVWPRPRAVHFDGETMRTFQGLGLGDAVAAVTVPMRDFRFENEAGEVLIQAEINEFGPQGWADSNMFHQPDVDALLRAALERFPSVELRTGHIVESFTQTEDSVIAVVVDPDGGRREYTARYLVACDGAASMVRHELGVHYEELGPNDPWLVVDGLFREEPTEKGYMVYLGHHSRPHVWVALPGMRRRMEFNVLPEDDREAIGTPEWVAQASGGLMTPETFSIERTAVYTFRSCLAPAWRDRRVFLAGDAVHLTPPLLGQGLCAGLRDAQNLAWKLRLVLAGADEAILDTYESERKPHMRQWIEHATRVSGFMQTTDPDLAAQRDAQIRAHPEQTLAAQHPLGPGLCGSEAPAGMLSTQPQIDGTRSDDGVGHRFLIAATSGVLAALTDGVRQALAAAESLVVARDDATPGVAELLRSVGANAVVVRPDRYILDVAGDALALEAVIRRVLALRGASARATLSAATVD